MAKVLFYTATAEKFAALEQKNDQALYFITDTGELYKGAVRFGYSYALKEFSAIHTMVSHAALFNTVMTPLEIKYLSEE